MWQGRPGLAPAPGTDPASRRYLRKPPAMGRIADFPDWMRRNRPRSEAMSQSSRLLGHKRKTSEHLPRPNLRYPLQKQPVGDRPHRALEAKARASDGVAFKRQFRLKQTVARIHNPGIDKPFNAAAIITEWNCANDMSTFHGWTDSKTKACGGSSEGTGTATSVRVSSVMRQDAILIFPMSRENGTVSSESFAANTAPPFWPTAAMTDTRGSHDVAFTAFPRRKSALKYLSA